MQEREEATQAACECGRPSAPGGRKCWGCRRSKRVPARGERYATEWARLQNSAIGLSDADSENDADWRRAQDVLRKAAISYVRSLGWRPPESAECAGQGGAT